MTQRSFLLKSFFPTLGSVLMIVSGCGKTVSPEQSANAPTIVPTSKLAAPQFQNLMDLAHLGESKRFQDSGFGALGSEALLKQQQESKILPIEQFDLTALPASAKFVRPRGAALIGGSGKVSTSAGVVVLFPAARLGESFLFGGVITGVSDLESDQLGGLKLSGINTVSVRPLISSYQGQVYLSLVGCLEKCGEGAKQLPVADIPVLGVSADQNEVVLDLSALSSTLKIQDLQNFDKTVFEPTQQAATLNTQTSLVDFSLGSLVFDVVSQMKLVNAASEGTPSTESLFDLTTRFFLRPESSLDSSFAARPNVPGLKYFETSRVAQPAITRFSLSSSNGMAPIHYYVKNVPKKWKSSFDKAFAAWAASFKMLTGREILTWEHVVEGSDLDRNIITGDVRFNVLEWDLKNQASYGGLGPSISNETTGQLMAAHTLIQGPAVLKLYSAWYKTWQKARELQSKGNAAEAEALVAKFDRASQRKALKKTSGRLSLNSEIGFQLHSANDKLSDPLVGGEFFSFPETETYESYMDGYFQDMVTHELGHNFGLRHNFRGSLGRAGEMPEGRVSVSSMEYLDRNFRNFSRIGEHDFMAISYGYTGLAPYRISFAPIMTLQAWPPTLIRECFLRLSAITAMEEWTPLAITLLRCRRLTT